MLDSAVRHSVGQQPSTQTPRKLRDSCTDCASSKVKCSKEKPTCARCARRGVTCVYMASRRTGRTSSNASKGDAAQGQSQIWIGASVGGSAGSVRTSASSAGAGSVLASLNNTHNPAGTNRPSLRVGTPLLSNSTMPSANGSGQPTPGPGSGSGSGPDTDLWSTLLTPSALIADPAGLSPPLTNIGTDVGDLFDMGLHSPMLIDCPPEQPTTSTDANHHSDFFGDLPLSVTDPDTFPTTHHNHNASSLDWALPSVSIGTHQSPNCCLTVALNILTRLFPNAPSGCTLPVSSGGSSGRRTPDQTSSSSKEAATAAVGSGAGGGAGRTIESVISENKQIIESLTGLLECRCSQDEYLISLMTLIALKVMGWYAAAATDSSPPISPSPSTLTVGMHPPSQAIAARPGPGLGSGSASGSASPVDRRPSSSPSVAGPLGEQVLRLPATVGNYCVAGQHQGRMAAQLVLSELHRVQRLVNALSKRLESIRLRAGRATFSGSSSGASSVGGASGVGVEGVARTPPFSVPTFCQLEEDLRKRLRVLSSETIDVLRRA
ncbi:hypothetical protein VTI74DRAFT_8960 [Chaetomium olivicolor]